MPRQEIETNNEPKATDGKVGYKHPPVKSQFRKGQSGNPRGRRKGQRNLAAVLAEVLRQTVTVKQGGNSQRMSKGEALIQILLTKAHTMVTAERSRQRFILQKKSPGSRLPN